MTKKIMSVVLSVLMMTSSLLILPVSAFAVPKNEQLGDYFKEYYYDENDVLYRNVYDENGEEAEIDEEMLSTASESVIPAKFDSRELGNVTAVKDQNPLGSCWSFAFVAAAESSLVSQGYADNNIDLSEAHLAWFRANNYVEGSEIPVQQDMLYWVEDTFNDGGMDFEAVATVARWSGLALEKDYPYVNSTDTSAMHFDASEMFANDYNLVSARRLTKNNMAEVKQAIMQYGAVSTSMYYSADAINYSENGCCHYQKKTSGVNHGVTIVGWDDDFSASNFKVNPIDDGAWLVKNSWGTNANDNGYFWLSYNDKSCGEFMEVVAKPAGDYDNNYQYDGLYSTAAVTYSRTAYAANIFTANGEETIKGAGFYTFNTAAYTCTVSVYTGLTNASNPTSGKLRGSKNISCTKEGYYTVDFDNEYEIAPGEKFAIVVKYNNPSGSAFVPYENLYDLDYEYSVEKGQSFYSGTLGNWTDVTTTSNRGNIPIKAFTNNVGDEEEVQLTGISVAEMPKTVYFAGEEFDPTGLTLNLTYSNGETMTAADGFTVSAVDMNTAGTKTVVVNYEGFETEFTVEVNEVKAVYIAIASLPNKLEYTTNDNRLNTNGLVLYVKYNNGDSEMIDSGYKHSGFNPSSTGKNRITIIYDGCTTDYTITIKQAKKTLSMSDLFDEFIWRLFGWLVF